jgi:hypothetical protein
MPTFLLSNETEFVVLNAHVFLSNETEFVVLNEMRLIVVLIAHVFSFR